MKKPAARGASADGTRPNLTPLYAFLSMYMTDASFRNECDHKGQVLYDNFLRELRRTKVDSKDSPKNTTANETCERGGNM